MFLRELNLGNLDAKNELLTNSDEERSFFEKSYVSPPRFDIKPFLEGRKYFVLGLKGTGKTALLRYISLQLENMNSVEKKVYTEFILFKTHFSDSDRKDLIHGQDINNNTGVVCQDSNDFMDYENGSEDLSQLGWKYYIYSKIVDIQSGKGISLFQENKAWSKFSSLVKSAKRKRASILPALKRGEVTISQSPELKLEFDWSRSSKEKEYVLKFGDYLKHIEQYFDELDSDSDKLNLFFDELELSIIRRKQYERDVNLIKNLIFSIDSLNAKFRSKGFGIQIYGSIRREVKNAIEVSGYEINKLLSDFGLELVWHMASTEDEEQPILKIVTQRLMHQLNKDEHEIWEQFFDKKVQGIGIKKYILHNSWYRPRDVIRLLQLAQQEQPDASKFTHQIFDSIRAKYSEDSWIELREELRSKYKPDMIGAIERIFDGFKTEFTWEEFGKHFENVKEIYTNDIKDDLRDELSISKLKEILSDLYSVGFLGNKMDRNIFYFSFRGNARINLTKKFYIHPSMRRYFNLVSN